MITKTAILKMATYATTAGGIIIGLISNYLDKQERKQVIADEVSRQLNEQLKIVDKAGES